MVQYYTIEQAAQILRVTPDKLKDMVKQGKIRAFQDRGTLRFRTQEIDELARSQGMGSDPELQPGDGPPAKPSASGSGARRRAKTGIAPENEDESSDFDLSTDDDNSVSLDPPPSGAGKKTPGSGKKSKTPPSKPSKLAGPPSRSSDSDVRLVADGSDLNFDISGEEVPAAKSPAPVPRKSRVVPTSKPASSKKTSGKPPGGKSPIDQPPSSKDPIGKQPDSDVRLTPPQPGSDSDVKMVPDDQEESVPIGQKGAKTPSDSDIRLELDTPRTSKSNPNRPGSDPVVTEEIDLDQEAKALPSDAKKKSKTKGPRMGSSSPLELSDSDIDVAAQPTVPPAPSDAEVKGLEDSSSDFELTPMSASDSESELEISSDEKPALADDEVGLDELAGGKGASGINLQDPVDSGISLESDGSDEMEFELTLDESSTPKPPPSKEEEADSNSEFELSLDDDSGEQASTPPSDSEFELSLDDEGSSDLALDETDSGSDSEFELTLDEDGGLTPVEEQEGLSEEDKDLFEETDFDVPSLDDESGSEAMALDESSELALEASAETPADSSSEFDLDVDESGLGEVSDSESQVVPLDEDEADDGAATVARRLPKGKKKAKAAADLEDEGLDLDLAASGESEVSDDDELAEDEEEADQLEGAPTYVETEPAPWGVVPVVFMLPCVIILFVVGMMSFELIQGMWGYHKNGKITGMVIDPIARMFDDSLPKE